MQRRHSRPPSQPPPAEAADDHARKLSGVRPISHDEDADRPTREERAAGGSPFDIPVPIPRFLRSRRSRHRG